MNPLTALAKMNDALSVESWAEDCLAVSPHERASGRVLLDSYNRYSGREWTLRRFSNVLVSLGVPRIKTMGMRLYVGLVLRTDVDPEEAARKRLSAALGQ
jgi:hypothetical protein